MWLEGGRKKLADTRRYCGSRQEGLTLHIHPSSISSKGMAQRGIEFNPQIADNLRARCVPWSGAYRNCPRV
jgi:hypothetical protein